MRRFLSAYTLPTLIGVLLAIVLLNTFPQLLQRPTAPELPNTPLDRQQGPVSYSAAVERAAPAVVNIYSSRVVAREEHPLMSDPFFRQFFGDELPQHQRLLSSLGSGVIVSEDGYVLTNHHVIDGADEIRVALRDGRETLAEVIGTDPESDLAVLRITLESLPVITLADSVQVAVGDIVMAIGNPFGVGQTVTMGIISATGRNHLGLSAYEDFIQTDAAINPGNSGGALIDAEGALVGINTAIFSRSGGSQGVGFAIPTLLANTILEDLITQGRVIRGWLGIEAQELTPELAASFGLQVPRGLVISGVVPTGPADQVGLQPGDVLLEIDGSPVLDGRVAMGNIALIQPGATLPLTLVRSGKVFTVELEVGERPLPASNRRRER